METTLDCIVSSSSVWATVWDSSLSKTTTTRKKEKGMQMCVCFNPLLFPPEY